MLRVGFMMICVSLSLYAAQETPLESDFTSAIKTTSRNAKYKPYPQSEAEKKFAREQRNRHKNSTDELLLLHGTIKELRTQLKQANKTVRDLSHADNENQKIIGVLKQRLKKEQDSCGDAKRRIKASTTMRRRKDKELIKSKQELSELTIKNLALSEQVTHHQKMISDLTNENELLKIKVSQTCNDVLMPMSLSYEFSPQPSGPSDFNSQLFS